MEYIEIPLAGQGNILLPSDLSRSFVCKKCKERAQNGKIASDRILLFGHTEETLKVRKMVSCPFGYEPGLHPHYITELAPAELTYNDETSIWLFYTRVCGIENCGFTVGDRLPDGRYQIIFIDPVRDYMSLEEFIKLDSTKDRRKYLTIE